MAVREVLTGFGLNTDTAEAVMNAYATKGDVLTVADARALVQELDRVDPEAAARGLLSQLAGDVVSGPRSSSKGRMRPQPAAPSALKGFRYGEAAATVRPADDGALFDACVAAMRDQRGEDWRGRSEWKSVNFPEAIVAAARAKLAR